MSTLITSIITGLGSGAVYALLAVSFVIIFRPPACSTSPSRGAHPRRFFCSYFAVQGLPFFARSPR